MPGETHVVKQGETVPSVSANYGFRDWETVWNDSDNSDLRKQRDPNVLLPTDVIHIPEKKRRKEAASTGQRHRFRAPREKTRLIVRVLQPDGSPYASTDFKLTTPSCQVENVTDSDGWIDVEIAPTDDQASVEIADETLLLLVGHLDPVDEQSGWTARLTNMGYLREGESDPINIAAGVENFQSEFGLKVDAIVGPQTIAKLKQEYGG